MKYCIRTMFLSRSYSRVPSIMIPRGLIHDVDNVHDGKIALSRDAQNLAERSGTRDTTNRFKRYVEIPTFRERKDVKSADRDNLTLKSSPAKQLH